MCKKRMFFRILPIALIALVGLVWYGCTRNPVDTVQQQVDQINLHPDTSLSDNGRQVPEQTATAAWWWNVNLNIWSRAMKDVGKVTGMSCKDWASNVVRDATGFSLPSTQSNWIYLNSGHVIRIVDGNTAGGGTIESGIGFGNIVQMHIMYRKSDGTLVSLPHTAIFYEYVPGGMNWIDCNFVASGKVDVHFVSWDWFRSRVGTRYSIYQATNW